MVKWVKLSRMEQLEITGPRVDRGMGNQVWAQGGRLLSLEVGTHAKVPPVLFGAVHPSVIPYPPKKIKHLQYKMIYKGILKTSAKVLYK